jgi:hypothetical protein
VPGDHVWDVDAVGGDGAADRPPRRRLRRSRPTSTKDAVPWRASAVTARSERGMREPVNRCAERSRPTPTSACDARTSRSSTRGGARHLDGQGAARTVEAGERLAGRRVVETDRHSWVTRSRWRATTGPSQVRHRHRADGAGDRPGTPSGAPQSAAVVNEAALVVATLLASRRPISANGKPLRRTAAGDERDTVRPTDDPHGLPAGLRCRASRPQRRAPRGPDDTGLAQPGAATAGTLTRAAVHGALRSTPR